MASIPERAEGASDGAVHRRVPGVALVLASTSPRRRALLEQIGVSIEVRAIDVAERVEQGEDADAYQARIVDAKLAAAIALSEPQRESGRAILVADTEVVLDGRVLGKPDDDAHGVRLLEALAGRAHEVRTRFALDAGSAGRHVETVTTRVHVRALDRATIERYVATGEGRDKAGGYAAQGRFAFAITRIDGSYTNVVGLPLAEVAAAMERLLGFTM